MRYFDEDIRLCFSINSLHLIILKIRRLDVHLIAHAKCFDSLRYLEVDKNTVAKA